MKKTIIINLYSILLITSCGIINDNNENNKDIKDENSLNKVITNNNKTGNLTGENNLKDSEKNLNEPKNNNINLNHQADLLKLFDNSKAYLKIESYNTNVYKNNIKSKDGFHKKQQNSIIYELKTEFDTIHKEEEGFIYVNKVNTLNLKTKMPIIQRVKYGRNNKNIKITYLEETKGGFKINEDFVKDAIISPNLKNSYKKWDWNEYRCKKPHCNRIWSCDPPETRFQVSPNCCGKTSHSNGVHFHNLKPFITKSTKFYFISKGMEQKLNINKSDILAGIRGKNIAVIVAGTERILQLCEEATKRDISYAAFIHSTC